MPRIIALPLIALLALAPGLPHAGAEETYTASAACAWDDAVLDVQVVTPLLPPLYTDGGESGPVLLPADADAHAQAAADAVLAWRDAMHAYAGAEPAAAHLAAVDFRVHVVRAGEEADAPPADVRILFSPTLAFPAGAATTACTPASEPLHCSDDGTCVVGGAQVVLTQWFIYSMTLNDTYNIALHEFGHALGLHHVPAPQTDLMFGVYHAGIGHEATPRDCPSTLNLAQLSKSYEWLGAEEYAYWPAPVALPASQYALVC